MAATTMGAKIAPTLVAALKTPVAKALSFFGNHSATALIAEGKFPDSPIPRPKRATTNPQRLNDGRIAACNIPKTLQVPMLKRYPFFVPSLSIILPIISSPIAYANLNETIIIA